jgi:NDP-sugar pyrophosphorylase family protein
MILHQIEALAAAGVTDIVLAVNYRPEIMEKFLREVSCTKLFRIYLFAHTNGLMISVRVNFQHQNHLLNRS